jgi:hypothetical protein
MVVYVNGSFVTTKQVPGDFDACWDIEGVDADALDPVFFDFTNSRAAQKARFGGEMFPAQLPEGISGITFLEFFQTDRNTGQLKAMTRLNAKLDLSRQWKLHDFQDFGPMLHNPIVAFWHLSGSLIKRHCRDSHRGFSL